MFKSSKTFLFTCCFAVGSFCSSLHGVRTPGARFWLSKNEQRSKQIKKNLNNVGLDQLKA